MTENCSHCGKTKEEHGAFSDHKYECNMAEAFSIGSGLSSQSVGAKKIEEISPCPCFDSVHEALLSETGTEEGGPGSGPQQGKAKKKAYDKTVTDPKTGQSVRVISDPSGLY